MSNEIEGKLIAEILGANTQQKIIDLLNEIKEINSPSFCYPLYEVYKKVKNKAYSHFILGALSGIDSEEIINIALEIGNESDTSVADLGYILNIFKDRKFHNPDTVQIGLNYFEQLQKQPLFCRSNDLDDIYTYSVEAGFFEKIESKIQLIYKDNNFELETRIYSLNLSIILNPDIRMQELLDNYTNLKKDEDIDIIIAKVLNKWKGPKVEELKTLIKNTGGIRAKHIIEKEEKDKEKKKNESKITKEETIQTTYSNADIVENIVMLRNKINSVSSRNSNIGFKLFPQNESIVNHLIASNDKPKFMQICSELRDFITDFNKNINIIDSEYSDEQKSNLLPKNTAPNDYKKSINRLFLFLNKRGFSLKNNVFGLRALNQISNLVTHSNKENQLIDLLKEESIYIFYKNEDFVSLHRELLNKYKDFLQNLNIVIAEKSD